MRITIWAGGFRRLPTIVETQLRRVPDRPPAGAAIQGQSGHEISIRKDQGGLLVGRLRPRGKLKNLRRERGWHPRRTRRRRGQSPGLIGMGHWHGDGTYDMLFLKVRHGLSPLLSCRTLDETRGRWLRGGAEIVGVDKWPQCS